jgi:hypothetical protein
MSVLLLQSSLIPDPFATQLGGDAANTANVVEVWGAACSMSSMCKGMAANSKFGVFTLILGIMLIGIGVLVLFQPQILAWLIAMLMIIIGIGTIFMARAMRRIGARMGSGGNQ